MTTSFTLVEDVCARLCHDLGGPLGSVIGALDLIEDAEAAEAIEVAKEGTGAIQRRLRLWRTAIGGGAGAMARDALGELLEGALGGGRVTADASGLGDLVLRPEMVRAVLLGAMLGAEALPRGGVVRIADVPGEVAIRPDGRNAAWPPALVATLAGEDASGARNVLAPLLVAVCARGRIRPALTFGAGPGAAPLMLTMTP